ncbi:hypothetical protein ACFW9N_34960 [Streptomyces sp. NPDC059496]|uniref:hypothetical protein n=1 Tax=Streptomyces sp. NPDC059496 TaxID=3346851 RepID=UPI0036CA1D37
MLRLRLNEAYFPFGRSRFGVLREMAAAQLVFERSGTFVFMLRFLHRIMTTEEDAREVVHRLEVGMRGVRARHLCRFMRAGCWRPRERAPTNGARRRAAQE